jgi:glycosyltransferase involved in cell wall biosynthesis
MKIGINAMQVRAAKSGVGQYIYALLDSAVKLAPDDEFLVYCNAENEVNYTYDTPNSSTRVWGLSGARRPVRLSYEYAFLPGELRREKLNVFHGASNFLPPRKACPYVVTIHDLSYHVHPERCPPVRRYYWYAMTARTVKMADRIITISENSRRDIEHFFPGTGNRIRVVPEAAHHRFHPLDIGRDNSAMVRLEEELNGRPYVLYLGTLEPGKNVARTVRAFDSIAARFPDHVLVLAGDKGWLYEAVFEAINGAANRDRIKYLGHVSDSEAVALFNFADLFVFPSLYEGFGLPPLEAMACGCPVVTSDRSSIPEVVGEAAIQVNPESVEELAAGMARVLDSEALRKEMADAGIARAAKFSWDRCAEETLAVYREVVTG